MQLLKTHTISTGQNGGYLVYWTNSPVRLGGLLEVTMARKMEDAAIAAELSAIQHLLEDKCVIGQNAAGNANTRLMVSQGAIRKLQRGRSDKAHLAPYANFLTTRFAGCPVSVEKDTDWFEGRISAATERLVVDEPRREKVQVPGVGEVSVTRHVLDRFADRFLGPSTMDSSAHAAWKKLVEAASDPSVREVKRESIWAGLKHARPATQEGRYFLNGRRNIVLVVTNNPGEGPRLVTAYPANRQFHMQRAA
jgi:hypothetical protein